MESNTAGRIMIECPNTIFQLYVNNEDEISKIEIFMRNIRTVKSLSLTDIYTWCNRQGITYDTRFNYHSNLPIWKTIKSFIRYTRDKNKYQLRFEAV